MTKFNDRLKFLLKMVSYISIICFIPVIITALFHIYNEGVNIFHKGVSAFLLILLCTFLLLLICNQLKNGLIFSSDKIKFPEELIKNNKLKLILKVLLRIILYSFIVFLSATIIILLIDFSDEKLKTFPVETTQFLISIVFISILLMLYKDFKKIYKLVSNKIKFLEDLPEKIASINKKIKDRILKIELNFLKKMSEKIKKILDNLSDKIENFVDLLEDKINYPEKNKIEDRFNLSNWKEAFKRFLEISYQILVYLTILIASCIFIPLILMIIYEFILYLIVLITTIWEVLVAIIYSL